MSVGWTITSDEKVSSVEARSRKKQLRSGDAPDVRSTADRRMWKTRPGRIPASRGSMTEPGLPLLNEHSVRIILISSRSIHFSISGAEAPPSALATACRTSRAATAFCG
eukprot:scaffold2723_cov108-Isochrysis_galbana.AAC.11